MKLTHPQIRMKQRAGLRPSLVQELEAKAKKLKLPDGDYYSILEDKKGNHVGFAAYKRKTGKNSKKRSMFMTTVYSRSMGRPRGQLIKTSSKINTIKSLSNQFDRNKKKIKGYAHERFLIEKKKIKKLNALGFKPSLISIPEVGQAKQLSFRGPFGLHAHDHGKYWVFHKDATSPNTVRNAIKHTLDEGVSGAKEYLSAIRSGKENMVRAIQRTGQ